MSQLSVVILAAGKGTRMKSRLPKVLHKLAGKELLRHVVDTATSLNPTQLIVVTGHESALVLTKPASNGSNKPNKTELGMRSSKHYL